MLSSYEYREHQDSPQQLAGKIIDILKEESELVFPIDPFELLSRNGIVYQFRDFKELEGIYLAPNDEEDLPLVGVNISRPIARQRFTAAHELCHHIKDRNDEMCPIRGKKNSIEKFADTFASELLMPRGYFEVEAMELAVNGYVSFEDALYLTDYFGVSFESCIFTLAYRLRLISGDTDSKALKRRIRNFKPEKKRAELGISSYETKVRDRILDNYTYFFRHENTLIWHKFKSDFVYNESRIEGSKLPEEEVAEIITDIRLNKQESEYCKSENQDIIETAGHSSMYDFIFETNDKVTGFAILKLHRILYQYTPYPDLAGSFRNTNNFVTDAKFETSDCKEVIKEVFKVDKEVGFIVESIDSMSVSKYIEKVIEIHHKLTTIHPFVDGNGRISRVFLNWLFKLKGLPPVYLKHSSKDLYYKALQQADLAGNYDKLKEVFYNEIMKTMIQLYDGRRI